MNRNKTSGNITRKLLALEVLISRSAEDLRDLSETMSGIQESMIVKYEESMESLTRDLSDEEKEEYYERNTDDYWQLATTFPGILNSSIFLSINSFLEFYMFQMCKIHEAYYPEAADLEKEGNSGICKYKSFMKKHKISDPFRTSSEWSRICVYRKVRNFIAHSDSILDETKNARTVVEFAEKNPGLISIDSHNKIRISQDCNDDYLTRAEVILHKLTDYARKKQKARKS